MNRSFYYKLLSLFPKFTVFLLILPVLSGVIGVLLPSLGFFPVIGGDIWGLHVFHELFNYSLFWKSLSLTFFTACISCVVSFFLALNIVGSGLVSKIQTKLQNFLIPVLAIPHASMALGLAFLISPGGWLMRVGFWIFGIEGPPPDWEIFSNSWGGALILGLILKETPFLILMILVVMEPMPVNDYIRIARSMGYGVKEAWWRVVVPQLIPKLRLPFFAVLAYAISSVDMAVILGPSTPPTLAVLLLRWLNDVDLSLRFLAASGAVILLLLTLMTSFLFYSIELCFYSFCRSWMVKGASSSTSTVSHFSIFNWVLFIFSFLCLLVLGIWSFAFRWSWPSSFPTVWSLRNWERYSHVLLETLNVTIVNGIIVSLFSIFLVIGCLEHKRWNKKQNSRVTSLFLYSPLLIPQATFLMGVQIFAVWLNLDGSYIFLAWMHLLFVVPYLFIGLSETWSGFENRYEMTAQCFGKNSWEILLKIKIPILLKPILIAISIGFAVSVALYLPTIFAGSGKIMTITTEAVARASGADRRVIGVFAFVQAVLPLSFLIFAFVIGRRFGLSRIVEVRKNEP